jgi:hypothetical protein
VAAGDELSGLDFSSMIGGPLNAVIKAQAQSAQTSVDFIKSVGFKSDDGAGDGVGDPQTIDFSYKKPVGNNSKDGKVSTDYEEFTLSVPLLTMLPIPFIRVQETAIDFNAKINSVQETNTTSSDDLRTEAEASGGWGPFAAKLNVSYAHQASTTTGEKVERTHSMGVSVKAVQEDLPAGTDRLLSILESTISEKQKQK